MSRIRSLWQARKQKQMDSTDHLLEELAARVIDLRRDVDQATDLLNRVVRLLDKQQDQLDDLDVDFDELTERVCDLEGDS